ncbi:aminoglycoside phosphotransferase family protein [Bacillus cereus group sp. BfR-BA-01310]|uniref:aminoglycoside phosphotransferase family protein n=1 Tax=Bacillus cereus group sp. BfR-BA-01310 TaxID=2920287 RepID=UPI001F5A135E|nr:aminoglycoside phosphotransferase family protein [Bacillus cereus group sp. BfR-BA-01310]
METILKAIERKLDWPLILRATVISKGFSFDEKYKIELESGETYFIKVCDSSYFERKQEEYEYMQRNHKDLLKNRPIVFLHDDFHPANIMIEHNEFRAVIDFARFDFGDPIHDFYKVALFTTNISVPFAVGQVHGYCGGEPSLHFWKLYSLYAAMIFPSDIVWTNRTTPHLVDDMKERLNQILEEHNDFSSYVPRWYQSLNTNIVNDK